MGSPSSGAAHLELSFLSFRFEVWHSSGCFRPCLASNLAVLLFICNLAMARISLAHPLMRKESKVRAFQRQILFFIFFLFWLKSAVSDLCLNISVEHIWRYRWYFNRLIVTDIKERIRRRIKERMSPKRRWKNLSCLAALRV